VVKTVQVTFASGKQILDAYWGYLANGGLVLPASPELVVGDELELQVRLESQQRQWRFLAVVVKRPPSHDWIDVAYISFHPNQPHDLLLSAAWAEAEHTAARKSHRHSCDLPVRYAPAEASADGSTTLLGRLMNVSENGALIRAGILFPVGTEMTVDIEGLQVRAWVAWRLDPPGMLMGLSFGANGDPALMEESARERLTQLLDRLTEPSRIRVALLPAESA
jgi:PilZ domain